MNKNYYSPFKAVKHLDKIEKLRKGELIPPTFVQWDLTNRCNFDCVHCWYRIMNLRSWNKLDQLKTRRALDLLNEFKDLGIKAIEITGGGEPTMHPDFNSIIKKANLLRFEQALVTNGTLLDEEKLELIKNFKWVRFSIDASTPQTFAKVHRNDKFNVVIKNIKRLIKIKDKDNVIGFSFIVNDINYKEILEAGELAKKIGCDNFRISLAWTPKLNELFKDRWDEINKQIEEVKKLDDENFKVFAFSERYNYLSSIPTQYSCPFQHFVASICANGEVYPCCSLKFGKIGYLGNVNKQKFKDIWYGKKRKMFLKWVEEKGCTSVCWMKSKNDFINYLMEENPAHINFI